jgi:undecaprenyl-diphosphatase
MEQPDGIRLHHAVALGLLHGPTEILPISSSAHTALVPWLSGWRYEELDPAARKRFEVALHAGTLTALVIVMRAEIARDIAAVSAKRLGVLALAVAPPALVGLVLQGPIERRFGTPPTIVAGLLGGSAAMAIAERASEGTRSEADADARDGLALGLAQILALIPGVSRSGATLTAARARGFARADAERLSFEAGVPVVLGALVLKGRELAGAERAEWAPLAAGAAAAFGSTLAIGTVARKFAVGRSLLPYAAYRTTLAGAVLRRLRQNGRG